MKKLLVASFLLLPSLLLGQATSTLNGRISDQNGAVIPGATITVTQVGTGVSRTGISNDSGVYSIPALNPGNYNLKVESSGFATVVRNGVELLTTTVQTVDFSMKVAEVTQQIDVTGAAPLVETTQSVVGNSLRQTEVAQLPMMNRTFASMVTLLPGARELAIGGGAHGHASSYISFGGGNGRNFHMLVDGLDNKEDHDGGTVMIYSLEGVQEMKTLTTSYTAEYGRGAALMVMATKSGTNAVHGSAFGYGRNSGLISTDYFSDPANGGKGKPPVSRAQYGGSLGGPFVKDRLWYFGSFERVQQAWSQSINPSITQEAQVLANALPSLGIVPLNNVQQPFRDLLIQAKVNAQLSNNHSGFIRYASQGGYQTDVGTTTRLVGQPFQVNNVQHMWNAGLGWTWVLNPTTVNQFSWQIINYNHSNLWPPCGDATSCLRSKLSFPLLSVGPGNGNSQWSNLEKKFQFKDDLSKQIGSHGFKFGADYAKVPIYGGFFASGSPGGHTFFDNLSTMLESQQKWAAGGCPPPPITNTNPCGFYPQGIQTPGIVRTLTVSTGLPLGGSDIYGHRGDYRVLGAWFFGGYVQDDWKVTPRLTLNLGVRYDVYDYLGKQLAQNRMYQTLKAIGSYYGQTPNFDKNNIAPRVGFAWDIGGTGQNVIRGGWGLFYGFGIMNSYFQQTIQSKDIVYFTQSITSSSLTNKDSRLANYVYGVSPLPLTSPYAPTDLPVGQNANNNWYDPALRDYVTQQAHIGYTHALGNTSAIAVDYTHILGLNGWRSLQINPLLPNPNGGARRRPLSFCDYDACTSGGTAAVYADQNRLGGASVVHSKLRSQYDEMVVHFQKRMSRVSFQANYTLSWARGFGATGDGTTEGGGAAAQVSNPFGGEVLNPREWGFNPVDERHRANISGVFSLPFAIDVSPTFTVATARPYTITRGNNPDGGAALWCFAGVRTGDRLQDCKTAPAGTPTVGISSERGLPLVNFNTRVTKNIQLSETKRISGFAEFYNLLNRANFGNSYGGNALSPSTFLQPTGYLGGNAATSSIAASFQVQFGARFSF